MPNQPEITAPVSRGRDASLGSITNYGTAKNGVSGGANVSVGAAQSNGNQSMNQVPISPVASIENIYNGAANGASTSSSQSPEAIQGNVNTAAVHSEYVARTTAGNVSSPAAGYYTNYPRTDKVPQRPDNGFGNKNYDTTYGEKTYGNPNGIETSREFGSNSDDLERIATNAGVVEQNPNKKIDGAKPLGDPTPQERETLLDGETNPDFPEILGQ